MSDLVVIVLPSWLVFVLLALAAARIAQNLWHIMRLMKLDKANRRAILSTPET